jgi:hypothetical protein
MPFPLQHPEVVARDEESDDFFVQQVVLTDLPQPEGVLQRTFHKLRKGYAAVVPEPARTFVRNLRSHS